MPRACGTVPRGIVPLRKAVSQRIRRYATCSAAIVLANFVGTSKPSHHLSPGRSHRLKKIGLSLLSHQLVSSFDLKCQMQRAGRRSYQAANQK